MTTSHIVARFDQKLEQIKSKILQMGELVGDQISSANALLVHYDATIAERIITTDRKVNGMNKDVHKLSERLIALRQPVALDLRQTLLPMNIAVELERIGDHAKSTAKKATVFAESDTGKAPDGLGKMTDDVLSMLKDVLEAYHESDIDLAAKVRDRDADVDAMNTAIFAESVQAIKQSPEDAEYFVQTILQARQMERTGDHVVNIARHVHQISTGEDLKASK